MGMSNGQIYTQEIHIFNNNAEETSPSFTLIVTKFMNIFLCRYFLDSFKLDWSIILKFGK
jgi:hypothetical protein